MYNDDQSIFTFCGNFLISALYSAFPKQKAFIWRATLRREPMNTRARLYSVWMFTFTNA